MFEADLHLAFRLSNVVVIGRAIDAATVMLAIGRAVGRGLHTRCNPLVVYMHADEVEAWIAILLYQGRYFALRADDKHPSCLLNTDDFGTRGPAIDYFEVDLIWTGGDKRRRSWEVYEEYKQASKR